MTYTSNKNIFAKVKVVGNFYTWGLKSNDRGI